MPKLPKLKIKLPYELPYQSSEEICGLEQAKDLPYGLGYFVIVGNQVINSYEELVQLATQDCYKGKEFLEVKLLPFIAGGG